MVRVAPKHGERRCARPRRRGLEAPLAVGCDHPDPEAKHETALTTEQQAALQADLEE